jgi:peptidoglycan/xylan/chitin deacetylase (PgdA/CDA1 family)
LPTAYIGKTNAWDNFINRGNRLHLSAVEIKQLADAGVEFGSHSHTHCDLSLLGDDDIEAELLRSKQILEALIGREVRYVAYPFGRCNNRVIAIAKKLGYWNGFLPAPLRADEFSLGRTSLNRLDSALTYRAKLQPNILSGAECLKGLIINRFSHLTPLLARFSSRSHSR